LLLVSSVLALLWVGGPAPGQRFGRLFGASAPQAEKTATFIVAAAMIVHLVVVAVPRTQGPDAQAHVVAAKAYAFKYLGDEEALRALEMEGERTRR
jgi:uncharacterized MAPEG superfamily protein